VACTVVLLAVTFCVVYPLLLVVLESFQVAPPGQPAQYGLDGWRAAFAEPLLRAALVNTLKVTVARQVVSLALSILQLDFIAQRKFEEAMVVACIIMAISLAGALVARVLGLRGGLG
jgi:iron(III) transport system permease protein